MSIVRHMSFPHSLQGGCVCPRWLYLPERGDFLPQLQIPVHLPGWPGGLRAALQPGRYAAGSRLPVPAAGPGAGRLL